MSTKPQEIYICDFHQIEYPTPLISTMAFRHCELWCPYCGRALGLFDGGTEVPWTPALQQRHDQYEKKYSEYLHAKAVTYAGRTKWQGKMIPPEQLPESEKERLKYIRNNAWKPEIKIEDIHV